MSLQPDFLWPLGIAAAVAIVVAIAGAVLTEIGPWYEGLKKPGWKPPDLLIGTMPPRKRWRRTARRRNRPNARI